jgi:acetyl-CoA synthetase
MKGTAIAAFVILKEKEKTAAAHSDKDLQQELRGHVARKIGAIARPDKLFFVSDLPKTRSGKIMRRLLRDIAEGRLLGDTSTLADAGVVAALKDQYEDKET